MYESVVFSCCGSLHMYVDKRKRKGTGEMINKPGSTIGLHVIVLYFKKKSVVTTN